MFIPANKTQIYRLTIKFEDIEDVDQTLDLKAKFTTKFTIEETIKPTKNLLTNELLRKTNSKEITDSGSGDKREMYTFSHDISIEEIYYDMGIPSEDKVTITATQIQNWSEEDRTDYRFIGNAPNNYILFNDEMWRIIGVFTVETENGKKEQRVKIMREDSIAKKQWDKIYNDQWETTSLNEMLQNDYFAKKGEFLQNGLNDSSKKQISAVKYYTGWDNGSYYHGPNASGNVLYAYERMKYSTSIVGLMYASDIVFTYAKNIDNICFSDAYDCYKGKPSESWIAKGNDKWTMTGFALPREGIREAILSSNNNGVNGFDAIDDSDVHPVVYLNHDIAFLSGDGTQSQPYIIE